MKKKPLVALALVLIAAVGWGGWRWHLSRAAEGPLTLYGNVDIREVELAFRQPGRILKLLVDEGSTVKAGEVLALLDAKPYEDALALAKAQNAQAQAMLKKYQRGSRLQEIAQAEAEVARTKAQVMETEWNFTRQRELAKTGAASEQVLEAARSAHDQAKAALAAATESLSMRREGFRREDVAAAEANLAAAEAAVAQAETARSDTKLLAPSDGLISARVREAGSMAANGAAVFTLSLMDPIYVRAYVSQPQLTRVQPGSEVEVSADGCAETFRGTVGFISPRAEFTPKSVETAELRTDLVYRVRIVLPGSAAASLRQGMPVTAHIP